MIPKIELTNAVRRFYMAAAHSSFFQNALAVRASYFHFHIRTGLFKNLVTLGNILYLEDGI